MRAALLLSKTSRARLGELIAAGPDLVLLDADAASERSVAERVRDTRSLLPGALVFVRIRPLAGGGRDELEAALEGEPNGIWLLDAVGRRGVEQLGSRIAVREAQLGIPDGATSIAASIDSAAGVLALPSLAEAGPRLAAIAYDGRSIAREVGCELESEPVRAARANVLLVAAAAGLPAIDSAAGQLPDLDAFAAEASRARRNGFSAKLARDLDELAVVKRISAQAPFGRWIENFVSGVATK